jgi:hypothetical protein
MAEPRRVRERIAVWWPAVIALESLLEAIPATTVNAAGQQPPVAAVSELSTALRQVATAVRAGWPVRPQPRLPRPPSLELVSDAVRSVQDAVAGTPLKPAEPLVLQVPRSWRLATRSVPVSQTSAAPRAPQPGQDSSS